MTGTKEKPSRSIGAMASDRDGAHNVVLHLLAAAAPDAMTARDLWAQTKGVLRWSLGTLESLLKRWVKSGLVVKDGDHWKVGESFRPEVSVTAAVLAEEIAGRQAHVAITEKLMTRHESISRILKTYTPMTGAEIWGELQGRSHDSRRTLQRDLVALEKTGVATRTDDGWLAGMTLRDEQFELRARAAALRLLSENFASAMPQDIQLSLRGTFANARKKLDSLGSEDPRVRWLDAIRLVPGHHPLHGSTLNPNLMDAIQDAVLSRTKLHLTWKAGEGAEGVDRSATGSVSHFLLELPDRPSIEFWPDGSERHERILFEDIKEAVGTRHSASWPGRHEPELVPHKIQITQGDGIANDGKSLVVLRVSDAAMRQLAGKKMSEAWEIDQEAQDGWTIVKFRAHVDLPLFHYLKRLEGVVILRPVLLWKFAQSEHRNTLRNYQEAVDLVRDHKIKEDLEYEEASKNSDAMTSKVGTYGSGGIRDN